MAIGSQRPSRKLLGPIKQSIKTRRKTRYEQHRGAVGNPRRGFSKDCFWSFKDTRSTGTLQDPPNSPQGPPALHKDHTDHPEHQRVPDPPTSPNGPLVSSINVVIGTISAVIPPKVSPFGWVVPAAAINPCSSAPGSAITSSRGTRNSRGFGFLVEPNLIPLQSH